MLALLSTPISTWSLGEILIAIVLIAAGIALVAVALRKFQITVPDWFIQVLCIVVVAIVVVMALRFIFSL